MTAIIITILIIGFLVWVINRQNSGKKPSIAREIIANNYLLLVTDAAKRKELLEEIEDAVEDHIKIDGKSRSQAEECTLVDLMKHAIISYSSRDHNGSLAYDQLFLCIAECYPQHLNTVISYQRRFTRT